MSLKFTDSHCHLDFSEFTHNTKKYTQLLNECYLNNIHQIIIPSVSPDNWSKVLNCCNAATPPSAKLNVKSLSLPQCHAALGIHPWFLKSLDKSALTALKKEVTLYRKNIVAIGETGIDKSIAEKEGNLAQQIAFFDAQILLAQTQKLPLILHHRKSHDLVLKQLKTHRFQGGGILHAFSGSFEQAMQYIALGFFIGVGGTITYPRAKKTINTVAKLPLESLMLETDAPAMPLQGFQGGINSPLRVIDVYQKLCEIRPENKKVIAETLEQNIQRFLALSLVKL